RRARERRPGEGRSARTTGRDGRFEDGLGGRPVSEERSDTAASPSVLLTPMQRALVDRTMPLLHRIAANTAGRYKGLLDAAELQSLGYEGLVAAAQAFETSIGVPFEQFAYRYIDGAIKNGVKKEAVQRRRLREIAASAAYDYLDAKSD